MKPNDYFKRFKTLEPVKNKWLDVGSNFKVRGNKVYHLDKLILDTVAFPGIHVLGHYFNPEDQSYPEMFFVGSALEDPLFGPGFHVLFDRPDRYDSIRHLYCEVYDFMPYSYVYENEKGFGLFSNCFHTSMNRIMMSAGMDESCMSKALIESGGDRFFDKSHEFFYQKGQPMVKIILKKGGSYNQNLIGKALDRSCRIDIGATVEMQKYFTRRRIR